MCSFLVWLIGYSGPNLILSPINYLRLFVWYVLLFIFICGSIFKIHPILFVAKSFLTLCDPMNCSMPGFPVLHYLPEFVQMPIESLMLSNYLILCCPLLLLPSIFPSIRVISSKSVLCIRRWSAILRVQDQPSNQCMRSHVISEEKHLEQIILWCNKSWICHLNTFAAGRGCFHRWVWKRIFSDILSRFPPTPPNPGLE